MHEKVDTADKESRGNILIEYAVPLRSLKLGLIGKADMVEFYRTDNGKWTPFPVEYKRGKPKMDDCDRIQLCAQAICLEEMLDNGIQKGALFYGRTRRRQDVTFDEKLRQETKDTAMKVHALIESGVTPKPEYSKRCQRCSLYEFCMPKVSRKAGKYLKKLLEAE